MTLFTGLSTLLIREVAVDLEFVRFGRLRGILLWARIWSVSLGAVVAAAIVFTAWLLGKPQNASARVTLFCAALILPLAALLFVHVGVLRGLSHALAGLIPDQLARPVFLCMSLALWFALSNAPALTPSVAMAFHVASFAMALMVATWWLARCWPRKSRQAPHEFTTSSWMSSALPLTAAAGAVALNNYVDILMLGLMAHEAQVGVYRVAAQVALLIASVVAITQVMMQSRMALLHSSGKHAELRRLLKLTSRGMFLLTAPVALLFATVGGTLLALAFGPIYAEGAMALAILAIGQVLVTATGAAGGVLNMIGRERDTLAGLALGILCNCILCVFLIPRFGINGAACAAVASLTTTQIFLVWRFRRHTGMNPTIFGAAQ